MDIHSQRNLTYVPCSNSEQGRYYYCGMACGYCKQCEYYIKELQLKDKQIDELQGKLHMVHRLTANLSTCAPPAPPPQDVGVRIPQPHGGTYGPMRPLNLATDRTGNAHVSNIGRERLQKRTATQREDGVSVIRVQDIIDKVVENSPPAKKSVDVKAGDERCIQSLLVKLDSDLQSLNKADCNFSS